MSLTACLKKAGDAISTADRAAVLSRARELRAQGLDTKTAAAQAVQERIDTVDAELKPLSQAQFKKPADVAQEPLKDYPDGYETDLFGAPVPRQQSIPDNGSAGPARAEPKRARIPGNAQPAAAVPGDAGQDAAGEFYVDTYVATPVQRELGARVIKTPADLAAATRYLYDSAVERFDAIVTDKNGKPLAVVGSFKGALGQTSVYPATVVGEAIRVPGAAHIWFSHNHPSGNPQLSQADEQLDATLSKVFRGSGIEPMGIIAVGNGKFGYHSVEHKHFPRESGLQHAMPPAAGVKFPVPVYERNQRDDRAAKRTVGSPGEAKTLAQEFYAKAKGPGMLLLDSSNSVAGWVPLDGLLTGKLRGTGGLRALYTAASRGNFASVIFVHGGELDAKSAEIGHQDPVMNIGAALRGMDVRVLDAINVNANGAGRVESRAERGLDLAGHTAYARGEGAQRRGNEPMPSGLTMDEARAQIRAMRGARANDVQKIVDETTGGWKGGPTVTVVQTATDLPGDNPPDVRGLYERGHVWIVAGAHRSGPQVRRTVLRTLAHETVAHFGLRHMLGREGWTKLMNNIQLGVKAGNRELRRIQAFVQETYRNEDGSYSFEDNPIAEADEIAAKAVEDAIDAEGNFKPGFGFLKSVWAKVAQFLRDLGLNVQFTNAELQGMLVLSMRNIEAGQRTVGGGPLAVAAAREDGPMHHRAFHGTPHDFERFTTEKMGTGEGAQAYGWGMYFAESKAVGESYRRVLTTAVQYKGEGLAGWAQTHRDEYMALPPITKRALAWARDYPSVNEAYTQAIAHDEPEIEAEIQRLARAKELHNAPPGHLYQVEIPDNVVARMLLWDKPMSEQPKSVRDAIASLGKVPNLSGQNILGFDPTGEELYRSLSRSLSSMIDEFAAGDAPRGWGVIQNTINDSIANDEAASKALDALGIPGIKFLDGQSRNRPLKDIKREFLAQLPEDADFEEVLGLANDGTFSPTNAAIVKALAADDWLGFDYPSQAISAALSDRLSNFDASPALVQAVKDAQVDATHNLVVFNEKNVEVTHKNGQPVTRQERDDFLEGAHARAAPAGDQQDEAAPPVRPQVSPWRDGAGRLQFAPGAWLYDKLGAAAGPLLSKLQFKAASPELRRALRDMKLQVQNAQETAAAVAGEAMKLSEAERNMVSDLIEKELAAGTIPPEHAVRLAAMINASMGAQTDELVRLGMLTRESAEMWRDKYLPRFYRSKLALPTGNAWADALRRVVGMPKSLVGIKGKHLKGRGLYQTVAEAELPHWEAMGWQVRDPDFQPGLTGDGTVQVWRDFTPAERESMGEIRDAGFRFVMGYMQTQRDIALGRMFEQLAGDPGLSSRRETEAFSVQVPDGTVPGTGAKRYGRLAGRWVSSDTMSHLTQIEEAQSAAWRMYRHAMAWWKLGKTAMNPVSHVNNMLSNLTMAHFGGVSYWRADRYLAAAHDFATKADGIKEAKEAGLFLGTLSEAELYATLPEDLKALVRKQEGLTTKVARTGFDVMTFFLRRPMGWAYQAEDTFFRYLLYSDARNRGMEPADAVDHAQRFIFTYDDLPKGARLVRDFGIPFFAYTYKAAPVLLHTALAHPLRFAAPAALLWAANAAAYAIAAGDDDDDWREKLRKYLTDPAYRQKAREMEQLEREHLPPWMKGTTALLTPKTLRLGMDEVTKLPLFIDISRIIPGGDLFDVSPNAGGIPIPQPITPSHPLFTTAVAMLANKDLFFGKDLVDLNDTRGEAAAKRTDWLWKQLSPAIAIGNYHFERGMNALAQASGGEVKWLPQEISDHYTGVGRDGTPVQTKYALANTFGIKVRPIDLELAGKIDQNLRNKMIHDVDAEVRKLQRLNAKGAVSDNVMEKERAKALEKKQRLREGLTVDGDVKD